MLSDIPAVKPLLAGKTSLLSKVRTQQVAKQLPDYIFESLASIGCAESEIAILTRCTKEELQTRAESLATGRARLKHALRRAQIKAALKGNSSMLIWLGKTYLAQRENPDPAITQQTNIVVDSKLLSALQSSYKDTLEDIRRVKHSDSNPDNQSVVSYPDKVTPDKLSYPDKESVAYSLSDPDKEPDFLEASPRGGPTLSLVTPEDTPESQSNTVPPAHYLSHYSTIQPNSLTESVSASNSQLHTPSETVLRETHPPGAGPTPQTHTPSPQMPTSHVSETLGNFGNLKPGSFSGKYLKAPKLKNRVAREP